MWGAGAEGRGVGGDDGETLEARRAGALRPRPLPSPPRREGRRGDRARRGVGPRMSGGGGGGGTEREDRWPRRVGRCATAARGGGAGGAYGGGEGRAPAEPEARAVRDQGGEPGGRVSSEAERRGGPEATALQGLSRREGGRA